MKNKTDFILCAIALVSFYGCQQSIDYTGHAGEMVIINNQDENLFATTNNSQSNHIHVSNIDQLYAAINDNDNEGATIVLAPGLYMLSQHYPNGGRLEFLHDMTITGQPGKTEDVIIDASNLPNASFFPPPIPGIPGNMRTGAVRMGNGKNAIEWLTLQNNPLHNIRALIQTDIVATPLTQIRIAHTIIKGSSMGVSILNNTFLASGRIIEATLEDNEIKDNTILIFGTAIQIQNYNAANDASIFVTLRRNHIHGNKSGIVAFNGSTERSAINIKSYNDIIENNGIGLTLNGGFMGNSLATLNNSVQFDAYSSKIKNNVGTPAPPHLYPACGIFATAGHAFPPFGLPGDVHHNLLNVRFYSCTIQDNAGHAQILGYGGSSFYPLPTPVGNYNTTNIYLHGTSANVSVDAIPSLPLEAISTNTINVY
jgi:hypothetical protein